MVEHSNKLVKKAKENLKNNKLDPDKVWEDDMERISKSETINHNAPPSNRRLIKLFLDDCTLRGYSSETIRSHRSNLRIISDFLLDRGWNILEADKNALKDLLRYLVTERNVGVKTQNHYFSVLSSFFEYLVYEEYAESNPVLGFRKRYLKNYKNHLLDNILNQKMLKKHYQKSL